MRLLREYVRFLLEGYMDDQKKLIEMYPEKQEQIRRMNPKMISWFIKRFGENSSIQEIHPFEDCVQTVKKYDVKASGLNQKYQSNVVFKQLVDDNFPKKQWSTPADYITMSIDDMELIMNLSERKKARFKVEGKEPDKSDYIGKIGPWNIWLPTTRENSVRIVGYNPESLYSNTTWCTTRVTGSNLFYNYAGRGVILYYLIKDNPSSSEDWLSIGFIDGEPVLDGTYGGVTVDRDNQGLNEGDLEIILGGYYHQIITMLTAKTKKIGNEHPTRKKLDLARTDVNEYNSITKGLSKQERVDLMMIILERKNLSPEVIDAILSSPDSHVETSSEQYIEISPFGYIIEEGMAPWNILKKYLTDEVYNDYKIYIPKSKGVPEHILEKLSDDGQYYVRSAVAQCKETPPHILEKLANDEIRDIKGDVASNPNTPVHVIEKFSNDLYYMHRVARNTSTPVHIFEKFADSDYTDIKIEIAKNPSLPVHIMEKFSDGDQHPWIKQSITGNENAPDYILQKLTKDNDEIVRNAAIRNLRLRKESKQQLAELRKLIQGLIYK